MTRLATVFIPQFPPEQLRAVARAADESGIDELWVWEDCFYESGVATAAAVLAWTERVHVAIGILPVPLRNVALVAMEAATLHRLFPGRVTLGVGHGVQSWMGQVGARAASPLTLLREHLTALRALLAGEKVTVDGRYVTLDGVELAWPPAAAPPVFSGGTGPKTLRLTGESADGTILAGGASPEVVQEAAEVVRAGREAAGRGGEHPLVASILVATGPGAERRLAEDARRMGWDPAAEAHVAGDAAAVAAAVDRWAAAGATTVVLQPTADEPDPVAFVRWVAEEVRPLVS
jgi:alkanesulfonate monooxygenase SsuD/methylene tetrahydromethanopterin reductase-like flavin-dependent oxidoreductase (luciferase family)